MASASSADVVLVVRQDTAKVLLFPVRRGGDVVLAAGGRGGAGIVGVLGRHLGLGLFLRVEVVLVLRAVLVLGVVLGDLLVDGRVEVLLARLGAAAVVPGSSGAAAGAREVASNGRCGIGRGGSSGHGAGARGLELCILHRPGHHLVVPGLPRRCLQLHRLLVRRLALAPCGRLLRRLRDLPRGRRTGASTAGRAMVAVTGPGLPSGRPGTRRLGLAALLGGPAARPHPRATL
mmetsp:Transcript_139247/g.445090  ORF Transcript_139247/g.445090 Transcript_139247/m.445090 type:complete len:233 (-) Transcript_139247:245-943(-)